MSEVTNEITSETKNGKWGVKEVVALVLFEALIMTVLMVGMMLGMFNDLFALLFATGIGLFLAGPVYMLAIKRVDRPGVTTILSLINAAMFMGYGNFWYLIVMYIIGGLAIDFLLLRTPQQRAKPMNGVYAWAAYGFMYIVSGIIPLIVDLENYREEALANRGQTEAYLDLYQSLYMGWPAIFIVIGTTLAAFLGAFLGKKLIDKHFKKAGAL